MGTDRNVQYDPHSEGKSSRILGITKPTFIWGPETQWGTHSGSQMFVLNTSKWSTGKSLNPIRNGKLSRIYSFKPHHNIRKWPYYYHSCFIDEENEVQGGKITCQGHRASNWWHWDLNPSCRGHTLILSLDHYDDLFWDQIRPKNKKGRWREILMILPGWQWHPVSLKIQKSDYSLHY